MYNKIDLFVFSGTGNTYKVAEIINECAVRWKIKCSISMIDKNSKPAGFKPDDKNLAGILFPTLGTFSPLSVIKFCLKLPASDKMNAFVAATGAWTRIGRWFIPGFTGISVWLIALILIFKNYKIAGLNCFGMPHNWTSLIPPYRKKLEIKILKETDAAVRVFADKIIEGGKVFKRIPDLIIGLFLLPLTLAYLIGGHFFLAKTMLSDKKCTGCGLCEGFCPNNAIIMKGITKKSPYWTFKCESCMRCVGFCPEKACSGSIPLFIVQTAVCRIFQFSVIFRGILKTFFSDFKLNEMKLLIYTLDFLFYFVLIFFVYMIFFILNRNSQLNRLFTLLNPASGWRKYSEPDINIGKLVKKL